MKLLPPPGGEESELERETSSGYLQDVVEVNLGPPKTNTLLVDGAGFECETFLCISSIPTTGPRCHSDFGENYV